MTAAPARDARDKLGSDAYWDIAQSWCRQQGVQIDAYREDTLRVVCDVHARLQIRRDRFGIDDRSLMRLHDAATLVMKAQAQETFISPLQALRWTLSRLDPERRAEVMTIIEDCAKARDLC